MNFSGLGGRVTACLTRAAARFSKTETKRHKIRFDLRKIIQMPGKNSFYEYLTVE
jgi:hypothetical protein